MQDFVASPAEIGSLRLRVLHLHFRWGAGSAAAVGDYIRATPGFEHHLVFAAAPGCQLGDDVRSLAASAHELPAGLARQIASVRRVVATVAPDIVHAHSSLAGVCARLALGPRWPSRVVYTPHCFAFERIDVSWLARAALWSAEAAMSFLHSPVGACSPREAMLARALPGRPRVVYVPNVAGPHVVPASAPPRPLAGATLVAAVGRLARQKGPEVFAEAARRSAAASYATEWLWIGGGEPALERNLREAGVHVTGWLPRAEAFDRLAAQDVYVHTAAWDGAPITVLEAAAANIPILARRSPAMEALGVEPLFGSAVELTGLLDRLHSGELHEVATETGRRLREDHTPAKQRRALTELYAMAAPRP